MDQEIGERLVGELAQMRGHFDQTIESLRTEVREGLAGVRGEVAEVREGLTGVRGEVAGLRGQVAEVRGQVAEVRGQVAEVREGLTGVRGEVAGVRGQVAEVRGQVAEVRRHSDVIAEDLRSKIQLVAESVAAVAAGQQELRKERKEDRAELQAMLRLSYADLDRRLRAVEKR
jgi:chromosome segregation ATPase